MREAIGGTSLMMLVAIFLTVYIGFMAIVINYGRVFRVKNTLLTYIESHEGVPGDGSDLIKTASNMGYNNGIKICHTKGKANTYYYSLEVSAQYSMPLISQKINIKIKGDTSAITIPSKGAKTLDVTECGNNGEMYCLGDCEW